MTKQEAIDHEKETQSFIDWLTFHENTLVRKIELTRRKVESQVVRPTRITHLSGFTDKDVIVDLIPSVLASMETIQARESFYQAVEELAYTRASIKAKKNYLRSYIETVKQELDKQAKPCTEKMVYDKLREAQKLENLCQTELNTLKAITDELPTRLFTCKGSYWEIYDTLNNFVIQHKG